jgi:hypothetical protein
LWKQEDENLLVFLTVMNYNRKSIIGTGIVVKTSRREKKIKVFELV